MAKGGTGTRVKREAAPTPQSLEDAAQFVREIGEMQREINLINAALTKKVHELTKQAQARSKPHEERFQRLFEGLYAFAQSRRTELTEEEQEIIQEILNQIFIGFKEDLLEFRAEKLSRESLDSVADGRILSGKQALEKNLFDQLIFH